MSDVNELGEAMSRMQKRLEKRLGRCIIWQLPAGDWFCEVGSMLDEEDGTYHSRPTLSAAINAACDALDAKDEPCPTNPK